MLPIYNVEFYHAGNLIHSVNSEATIQVKRQLTEAPCTFGVDLPTKVGLNLYPYADIVSNDQIKIYYGWTSADLATPKLVGNVYRIPSPLSDAQGGFIRAYTGKDLGGVLENRIKQRKVWTDTHADTIVTELATDLSLGTVFDGDASDDIHVTLVNDADTYWDIMTKLSDYWFDAGNQIKKDFYVDNGDVGHPLGHLVWKTRPFRITGVETLILGENIKGYTYIQDDSPVKNRIWVYGKLTPFNPMDVAIFGRKYPSDGDTWTWGTGWTAVIGTCFSGNISPKIGTTNLVSQAEALGIEIEFYRNLSPPVVSASALEFSGSPEGLAGYGAIEFWARDNTGALGTVHAIEIYCPDSSNYYCSRADDASSPFYMVDTNWEFCRYALGNNNVYNAVTNPNGQWVATGSPTWESMSQIRFSSLALPPHYGNVLEIDGLCFNFGRWRYMSENGASQTAYGIREMVLEDNDLQSDPSCQQRSECLLYQKKDISKRLDIMLEGNTNILLGDRIPITLAPENLSAVNHYVTAVEDIVNDAGFWTTTTMTDTLNRRITLPISKDDVQRQEQKKKYWYEGPVWRRGG